MRAGGFLHDRVFAPRLSTMRQRKDGCTMDGQNTSPTARTHRMTITNKTFEEIAVGDRRVFRRVVAANDLYVFASASGNLNPMHLPREDGDADPATPAVAPSMWLAALPSALLGTELPGPGTLYRSQTFTFHDRAAVGDELLVSITVVEKRAPRLVVLETRIERADGVLLADGTAEVFAPEKHLVFEGIEAPRLLVEAHDKVADLLDACAALPPLPTAVVCPEDEPSLAGAVLAAARGLITPVFVGDAHAIRKAAAEAGIALGDIAIEDVPNPARAAERAVALVEAGRAGAIMKGRLHSDELLAAVVRGDGGLRTSRRISHVFVMDVPGRERLLMVTDAAINIAPDLATKVDIVQNAIDLAHALGVPQPRVGILSAVETVNPKIPSTIDAAVLSKMAERGQIRGGLVDGPLAMDNAVDVEAARTKGIRSLVAGHADILVTPNLEAGNILAKELIFLSGAEAAGLVVGAAAPVMLTSRADSEKARLASAAVAVLAVHFRTTGRSAAGRHR